MPSLARCLSAIHRPARPTRPLTAIVLSVALGTALSAAPASAAAPVPPTPAGLPSGIEALADYVGANSCDAAAKPGSTALGSLLKATYAGTSFSIDRPCGSDSLSTSEHYDGRAVDWMVSVRDTTQRSYAQAALTWMLATDPGGNTFANARRLGVMYLIWNNRSWSAYRPQDGWREYNGCLDPTRAGNAYDTACHRNHVHISLSWAGAMKRSSYWSKAVAPPEFGPCRTWYLNWAVPSTRANLSRCGTPAKVVAKSSATALGKQLVGYSGMYLTQGRTGPAVTAVQSAIGTAATGTFSSTTRSALLTWQSGQGLPATGVTDAPTWRVLTRRYAVAPVAQGLDGDLRSDLLARRADGSLSLRTSMSSPSEVSLGSGWQAFDTVFGTGDFSGDAKGDVLARKPDGSLWLYPGTGSGTFFSGVRIGTGWQGFTGLLSPGDFSGDGVPDVLARRADGTLWLYAGDGHGRWAAAGLRIGSGWQIFDTIESPGDFTGDGNADVLARRTDGSLWLYAGNGRGGWAAGGKQVGSGWQGYAQLLPGGDRNRDGLADLLALRRDGALVAYYGNGRGGWAAVAQAQVAGYGWDAYDLVVGIR